MVVHTTTDVGRVRNVNEDSVRHTSFETVELLAVADGMGGHSAGDVASSTALDTLENAVADAFDAGQTDPRSILAEGIERANDAVLSASGDNVSGDMGTTLVAGLIEYDEVVLGNVGDSRAYLISPGRIERITTDQSLVQELVEAGTISPDEAREHPQRHVLAQALGTDESVDPDFHHVRIEDGVLLLCSDGLTEELPDETIQEVVTDAGTLGETAETLVSRANASGGSDNISVGLYSP